MRKDVSPEEVVANPVQRRQVQKEAKKENRKGVGTKERRTSKEVPEKIQGSVK